MCVLGAGGELLLASEPEDMDDLDVDHGELDLGAGRGATAGIEESSMANFGDDEEVLSVFLFCVSVHVLAA